MRTRERERRETERDRKREKRQRDVARTRARKERWEMEATERPDKQVGSSGGVACTCAGTGESTQ